MNNSLKRLILVRHGESIHNLSDTSEVSGFQDYTYHLTPKGVSQAVAAGENLRAEIGNTPVLFIVSDYMRARQTFAGIVKSFQDHPSIQVRLEPMVRERTPRHGNRVDGVYSESEFYRDEEGGGEGENRAMTYDRLYNFWTNLQIAKMMGHLPEIVVVVTHSGIIRALTTVLYGGASEGSNILTRFTNGGSITFRAQPDGRYLTDHPYVLPLVEVRNKALMQLGVPMLGSKASNVVASV